MVAVRIPKTDRIAFYPRHAGDFVFNMQNAPEADASVRQEDVLVIGSWQDYQSSGTTSTLHAGDQGQSNELEWDIQTKPDGIRFGGVTDRGANVETHRQRNKLITINV